MEENVVHIKSEIAVTVDAGVKNIIYVKNNIFEILLHVVVKVENI